jgi:hypothetical protein
MHSEVEAHQPAAWYIYHSVELLMIETHVSWWISTWQEAIRSNTITNMALLMHGMDCHFQVTEKQTNKNYKAN